MNLKLTKNQKRLQSAIQEFTKKEIEPIAENIDRQGLLPDGLIEKMADVDLLGMTIPSGLGGVGSSNVDCALAIEQLGYTGTCAWMLVAFCSSIPECIVRHGTLEQQSKYLQPVIKGEMYPSIQFTEPDTGSDPDALTTRAVLKGDYYIINGVKRFITFGARKGYAIVYAKDDGDKCTAFIMEKDSDGYSCGNIYELMGGGGIEAVDVYLDNVKLSKENILGQPGKGFNILLEWIATEKIQQCSACIGIAQAALDESMRYAKTRMVRGRPLSSLLNIRSMMAEMYAQIEAAKWYTYRAAYLKDTGNPKWINEAAAVKIFVVPATMDVVEKARRIHGAYGYTKEYKIERLYRAIAGASAIAVSLEVNKSIVSSSLLK